MHDEDKCDFLLKLLKDEIAAQANIFDQIDNKTGVALGFSFVAVGQVLAAVFRMATNQNHFRTLHPYAVGGVLIFSSLFVLLAVLLGAGARWPRSFEHSVEWTEEDLDGSCVEIKNRAIVVLSAITKTNDKTNSDKGTWAKATYAFVGLALIFYVALTVLLYLYSIPS